MTSSLLHESHLYAILPDQQVPYHDPDLHEQVLLWLCINEPYGIIFSGDFFDVSALARHARDTRPTRESDAELLTRELAVGRRMLREYLQAAGPGCVDRRFVPGNHEQRLEAYLAQNAPAIWGATGDDGEPLLSLAGILDLESLGIQWEKNPSGGPDYPHAQAVITPKLAVRHGWLARSGAGATALKTLETLGYSVIVGHTHRQAIVNKTYHEIDGSLRTLQAVEAGTLARVQGGLGYAVAPDWSPGFATVRIWPDGYFKTELAIYVNGVLIWGDQRYGGGKKYQVTSPADRSVQGLVRPGFDFADTDRATSGDGTPAAVPVPGPTGGMAGDVAGVGDLLGEYPTQQDSGSGLHVSTGWPGHSGSPSGLLLPGPSYRPPGTGGVLA